MHACQKGRVTLRITTSDVDPVSSINTSFMTNIPSLPSIGSGCVLVTDFTKFQASCKWRSLAGDHLSGSCKDDDIANSRAVNEEDEGQA